MRRAITFSRVSLLAVSVFVVLGALTGAAAKDKDPVAPPTPLAPTKPSDLVSLIGSGATCGSSPWQKLDTRVNPDGTLSPFVIPAGEVLVVTSVDWRQGTTDGAPSEFFLFPSAANIDVNYAIAHSIATPGSSKRGGGSFVVTGVAVQAGNPCWGINDITNIGSAFATVHGFLTADR